MPVGVPLKPCEVTVAVKVTACPKVEGFMLEVTVVVVAARLEVVIVMVADADTKAFAFDWAITVTVLPAGMVEGAV